MLKVNLFKKISESDEKTQEKSISDEIHVTYKTKKTSEKEAEEASNAEKMQLAK